MSYSLMIGARKEFPLATNAGLGGLRRWVESLPAQGYEELALLFKQGWSQEFLLLRAQLKTALSDQAPTDDTVEKTAQEMLANLLASRSAKIVGITDGMRG